MTVTGQTVTGQTVTGEAVTGQAVTGEAVTGQTVTGQAVTTLKLPRRTSVKNAHTQSNKNPTDGLVADTM